MVLLDESAYAKAGTKTAGAGRQRNGRLGKVDLCQVGVFLSFVKDNTWTWVDGELFLQEHWFEPKMEDERNRLGIPSDRTFKTKVELGWEMIQRAQANGLPFEAVGCDDLYGRANWFRAKVAGAGLIYMRKTFGQSIAGALLYAFLLLMLSTGKGVNIVAHFGGLAAGLIIGYALAKSRKDKYWIESY